MKQPFIIPTLTSPSPSALTQSITPRSKRKPAGKQVKFKMTVAFDTEEGMTALLETDLSMTKCQWPRGHILSVLGPPEAVAAAVYLSNLSPGGYVGADQIAMYDAPPVDTVESARQLPSLLFSLNSLNPPPTHALLAKPAGRFEQIFPQWSKQGMTPVSVTDPDTQRVTMEPAADARFSGSWASSMGGDLTFLLNWSERCPAVQITCLTMHELYQKATVISVQYGKLVQAGYIVNDVPEADQAPLSAMIWAPLWGASLLKDYRNATVDGVAGPLRLLEAEALLHNQPAHNGLVVRAMQDGPRLLGEIVEKAGMEGLINHSLNERGTGKRWNGISLVDAVIMGRGISSPEMDPSASDLGDIGVGVSYERVNYLSALCATNDELATWIGTEAGRTANGCHVVALMARAAQPSSIESEGVRNVLARTEWRPPQVLDIAHQDADRRTATALLQSGSVHAWNFLTTHGEPAMVGGYGAHASLSYLEDAEEYAKTFGWQRFLAVGEPMATKEHDRIKQIIDDGQRFERTSNIFRQSLDDDPLPAATPATPTRRPRP
jgi:hypothetical protein